MSKPDILVFMSDQHAPMFSSYEGGIARTPNMEKLCEDGTDFRAAYTSCPLCVPARISMLLGKTPSNTGVFSNDGAVPESSATFLHSLVATGYETVLIGRMHFVGTNQRHGFTKRFVGDMTPVTWNRPVEKLAAERGVHKGYKEPWCVNVIGGGDSPVLEYDKEVIATALNYLSKDHEKPQCIFVSTYGPHFPYVAPVDKYMYYKDKIIIPDTFRNMPEYLNPVLKEKVMNVSEETVINARAAYFGMIETLDEQLGAVRVAFNSYVERNGREGVFTYISDHGDQAGDRRMFGKETFFESSARIPFIMEGKGIKKKWMKINTPVSIMDLGPTLCEIAGANPPPGQEGRSLVPKLSGGEVDKERAVMSELIDIIYPEFTGTMEERYKARLAGKLSNEDSRSVISRMVRKGNYKYITYIGYEEYDLLFDIRRDPEEKENLADHFPEIVKELQKIALTGWEPAVVLKNHKNYLENVQLVKAWEKAVGPDDSERWNRNPEYARVMPKVT